MSKASQWGIHIIYGVDDPEEKLEIFNSMLFECLERHAPLKRVKITPSAPWLKDESINTLQAKRNELRYADRITNDPSVSRTYRESRNLLKPKIKRAKRKFMKAALSNRNSKELWQLIHRFLKPHTQPLKQNPDSLIYFVTTAHWTVNTTAKTAQDLKELIDSLPDSRENSYRLRFLSQSPTRN